MARKDMKKALGASLKAQEEADKGKYSRFDKAEALLGSQKSSTTPAQPGGGDGRVVRDSFTIPSTEYEVIGELRKRYMKKTGAGVTKSELLRAGLAALKGMTDEELAQVVLGLIKVKVGRPSA